MFDLIVKNGTLPDGRQNMDIACQGSKISAVERDITAQAGIIILGTMKLLMLSMRSAPSTMTTEVTTDLEWTKGSSN